MNNRCARCRFRTVAGGTCNIHPDADRAIPFQHPPLHHHASGINVTAGRKVGR